MSDRSEQALLAAIPTGAESAFEAAYQLYHERVRLIAWRISHRPDWVDDLFNEAWCRAYDSRRTFDPNRSFLVWMAGIVRNVYREECRRSPRTWDGVVERDRHEVPMAEELGPERLAEEAELLSGLNDCVSQLGEEDAAIVRLRFFDGLPLRVVGQKVEIPESTLRDVRIPAIYRTLRKCLEKKGIRISLLFPAQEAPEIQETSEEQQ